VYARKLLRPWVLAPLAFGTVALAACTPYGGSPSAASTGGGGGSGPAVATASTGLGTVLVDSAGRTLYDFDQDMGTTSTCDGECAVDWPPVAAPAHLPASLPGVSGRLGTTTRGDGTRQLTIAGHPV
jgi:predicted lipoprotein with Yx(FWY)xxD motif